MGQALLREGGKFFLMARFVLRRRIREVLKSPSEIRADLVKKLGLDTRQTYIVPRRFRDEYYTAVGFWNIHVDKRTGAIIPMHMRVLTKEGRVPWVEVEADLDTAKIRAPRKWLETRLVMIGEALYRAGAADGTLHDIYMRLKRRRKWK